MPKFRAFRWVWVMAAGASLAAACPDRLVASDAAPLPVNSCTIAPESAEPAGGAFGAASLWERFTGHLRSGRMREAYACFSPASRGKFPFEAFSAHYHPLTAAYEATLSPVDEGQFHLCGEYALLRFVAIGPNDATGVSGEPSAAGVLVTALLVREGDHWYLAAAAREAAERTEAEARNLLRRLARSEAVERAGQESKSLSAEALLQAEPRAFQGAEAALCLRSYDFSYADRNGALRLIAASRQEEFRSFVLGEGGEIRAESAVVDAPPALAPPPTPATELPPAAPDLGDPSGAP